MALSQDEIGAGEADRRSALRRTKFLATGALVACVGLFLIARAFSADWPALAYVAAFAEAAAIGGIADWYAVVALFRRPLGLPIPHTAIIPRNQDRIAANIGRFVETNFLGSDAVRRKLGEVDFAELVAQWLSDPERSQRLAAYGARLAPQMLAAAERSGLRDFLARRIAERIEAVEVAPLAADLLSAFTADRRHQKLLDHLVGVLAKYLGDAETLDGLRDRIRDELPSLARVFRADAYLLRKIVASAATLMNEVRDDPAHPIRTEFDRFVMRFQRQLRTSPAFAARADELKRDLLARPQFAGLAAEIWTGLRQFVERDAAADQSAIRGQLAAIFEAAGRHLAAEPALRSDMNAGIVDALASFLDAQKSGVGAFISEQVRNWDLGRLVDIIEVNVGRDLQYIRFNGMLVGGLAGLALFVLEGAVFG